MFNFIPLATRPRVLTEATSIAVPFSGDRLSIHLNISPHLDRLNVSLGTLFQKFGGHVVSYVITEARSVIELVMPETESLIFIPASGLYSTYGLTIHYAKLPTMSNDSDYVLPDEVSSLPARVNMLAIGIMDTRTAIEAIEEGLYAFSNTPALNWSTLQGKPSTFAPSSHTHSASEVTGLPNSGTNSQPFDAILANILLESNESYVATVSDLVFTLPSAPYIGDTVNIATGNFSTKVLQNTSQRILNLSLLTPNGADTGLILKPYSAIQLLYVESGLWVTGFRSRTINNWLPESIELTDSLKTYTASFQSAIATDYGTTATSISNNRIATGDFSADGLLTQSSVVRILCTFPVPTSLTSFDFYGGQGNVAVGTPNDSYKVDMIKAYSGNDLSNLLGTFSPSNLNGSKQSFSVIDSGVAYSSYVFEFARTGNGIGVLEVDPFGKAQIGGETVAV